MLAFQLSQDDGGDDGEVVGGRGLGDLLQVEAASVPSNFGRGMTCQEIKNKCMKT